MTGLKIKMLVIGTAVLGAFAWVVLTQGPLAPVKVTVEKIQVGTLANGVFGIGTVRARHGFNLAPTMTSRVKRVLVDQGDTVVTGQVLAEMDPVDLDEKFTGSERVVQKTANAILAAEAQTSEAESRLKTIAATLARYEELRGRGFVSQEMYDTKLHEKNAAVSALAAASANLATAREEHARAQADMRGIGKARAQTRLISPANGVVVVRLAEPGSTVVGGQVVLQVVDPKSLWIETRVAQHQAGQVRVGQEAEVVLRSRPHAQLAGKVARVDMVSDAVTEERIVNVAVAAVDASIGEYAEVTFKLPQLNDTRSVPTAAVKRIDRQTGVWVLQDGQVVFKPVKVGVTTMEGRTQILDGLDNDESVIVYSQQPLRAGIKVRVVAELVRG
ncbi:MAG TPA: efflux RND transporter periplasmic adaptor subunit [Gallionellaceae bacterium]|nr:efflux RND transporter periplasmic adaptor subunit [Gallionellaceae bacterium]